MSYPLVVVDTDDKIVSQLQLPKFIVRLYEWISRGEQGAMKNLRESMLVGCEIVGIGAALLLLPAVLVDLAFDTGIADIVVKVALLAVAATALLTVTGVRDDLDLGEAGRTESRSSDR